MHRHFLCLFLALTVATVPTWAKPAPQNKPAATAVSSAQANKAYYDAVHRWMAALVSEVNRFPLSRGGDIATATDQEKAAAIGALSAQLLVCRGIEEEHRALSAPAPFQAADKLFRAGVQTFARSAKKLLTGDASGVEDVRTSGRQIAQASRQIDNVWRSLHPIPKGQNS